MSFTRQNGVPQFISGDRVIDFYYAKDLRKSPLSFDLPTTAAYMEGEDQIKSLGELGFFGQRTTTVQPMSIDILQNRQVMETGHDGTFQYDVPFYQNEQCVTVRDTSNQEAPGIDETTFKIVLNEEFKPGDVLTSDVMYGQQIVVTKDQVLQKADSFEHIVTLLTNNRKETYATSNLREGVRYFKLFNILGGERETILSGVRVPNKTSKLTCEFRIGNGSGVELEVSAMANIGSQIGNNFRDGFIDELRMDFQRFTKEWGDVATVMDKGPDGMPIAESARLVDVAQWLVKREHMKIIENRAMFANAAEYSSGDSYVHIAEGLWHQMRRGKIIPYARKNGITRRHIKEATEYIFQGNESLQPEERYIKFKAGKYAYENVQAIYDAEFTNQMSRESQITNLYGQDGQLQNSPIVSNIDKFGNIEITKRAIKIKQIFLPGIGNIEVEHDPALDYLGNMADRNSAGMYPQGRSHGSHALVIWDARNQSYSNNRYTAKGHEFVEGAPSDASVYLVKTPGEMIFSGRSQGYYDPMTAQDIIANGSKQRFVDYFSWDTGCSYFLADPSAIVMIELKESDRRGFN